MKIIHWVDAFYPLTDGITSTIRTWTENLPEYDFEIVTNAFRNQKLVERYSDNVVIRRFLPNDIMLDRDSDRYYKLYTGKSEFLFFPYRVMAELVRFRRKREYLKKADYDILHFSGPTTNYELFTFDRNIGRVFLSRLSDFSFVDRPKVLTFHDPPADWLTKPKVHVENEKRLMKTFDNITCVSDFIYSGVKSYVADSGMEKNVWSIPNSIDISKFRPVGHEAKMQYKTDLEYENKIIVTYVGHLNTKRYLGILIESWKEVVSKHPNAHLLLVGGGYRKNDLIERANELKISKNIEFVGYTDNVYQFLRISDVFVFPTRSEGFGIAMIEAMACELPVISTNVSSIPGVVGDTGILVEPGNPEALTKAIIRLIDDEHLRKELGRKGRKRVEDRYSDKIVTKKIKAVYESLV